MTATAVRKHDGINWHAFAYVDKYSADQCAYADRVISGKVTWYRRGLRRIGQQQRRGWGTEYQSALNRVLLRTGDPEDGRAEADGNLLVTSGLTSITALLIGAGGSGKLYALTTSEAVCGVGSTTTSAVVGDTVLGANGSSPNGTTGAWYQASDASFPSVSAGVITMQSTFASGNANMAWQEWCWASGTGTITAGDALASVYATGASFSMWNHKIASLGTKASGAAWVFTTTITLS